MELTVNGVARSLPDGTTVEALVEMLHIGRKGVAVAVNGEVVARSTWPGAAVRDGDHVEVLRAAQGG